MTGSTACARVVVEELISYGVRDVVLAPGSRNAPLAYELFEADKIGLLRLHVRIDERSAGFTALGLAKGSATPVPVITTSGTAAANLHPAIMEAWHSRVPLIMITADRPLSMINTGANQTTRQTGLFAGHVRAEVQLSSDDLNLRAWRFQLNRALVAASGLRTMISGPVHINIGFSEPLVPEPVETIEEDYREVAPSSGPAPVTRLPVGPQTLVVAGDLTPEAGAGVAEIAARAGVPLLAEPSSNARGGATAISSYRLLLQSSLVDDIERVVVVGHTTLSRPVMRLLQRPDVELIIVDPAPEWNDPTMNADRVIAAFELPAQSAQHQSAGSDGPNEWLARWQHADRAIRPLIAEVLADVVDDPTMITGPALAELVWQSLGASDLLFVGSSSPIRDLDLASWSATPPVTYANRGLAGIDGSVSTAIGLALAADEPAHALLGDLTFLHDSNGLIIGPAEPRARVRFIVADDNGGSIFATLEQGHPAQMSAFERLFGTPHHTELSGIAAASGVDYLRITRLDDLREVLRRPPQRLEIVDVEVDRDHRRTLDERLNSLAATL